VVGDTVGDPFKDTSSVALNPVIKFTTLFGLLAVELAVKLSADNLEARPWLTPGLSLAFFMVSVVFVWRSFYTMRIGAVVLEGAGTPSGELPSNGDDASLDAEPELPRVTIPAELVEADPLPETSAKVSGLD
jgi:K(+)-stimulated pyrophosphate-energized sodium pump